MLQHTQLVNIQFNIESKSSERLIKIIVWTVLQIRWVSSVGSRPFLKKVPIGKNQATFGKILDRSLHFTVFQIHWTSSDAEPIGGRKIVLLKLSWVY